MDNNQTTHPSSQLHNAQMIKNGNDTTFYHTDNAQTDTMSLENQFDAKDSSSWFNESLLLSWQQTFGNIKHGYVKAADNLVDELLVTLTQKQVNDALYNFVTKNVGLLHNLKLDIHDNWLRLTCTVDIMGLYTTVASNFELVHLQLDRHTQRLVLKQIGDTDVIELHSKQWYKAPAARLGVGLYRTLLRKDPLPFILNKIKIKGIPFTGHKGNIIYLDIGRWLKNNDMIMKNLKKVQINDGYLKAQQLLLKVQPNFGDILSFGDPDADIITEKDNPKYQKAD